MNARSLLLLQFSARPRGLTVSIEGDRFARLTRDRPRQSLKIIGINLASWRAADRDVELFVIARCASNRG
jgi:hypothetical protein